jgi:methionyl-tRNA formyltransferase
MKILIIYGSHPRHSFVASKISQIGYQVTQIKVMRESIISVPPANLSGTDNKNFIRHFTDRAVAEEKGFNLQQDTKTLSDGNLLEISSMELNSTKTVDFVKNNATDLCLIFGTGLINEPLLSLLPSNTFNLHLGLSPWYRGAATLFWPFYFLEPQFAGITIHKITNKPDAGEIYHQGVPVLEYGQGIHDVAIAAVKISINPLEKLFFMLENNPELKGFEPKSSGRIWREKDFRPEHLRLIYDQNNNQIVDRYLKGDLGNNYPNLMSVL